MSEQNVEALRAVYAGWERGDFGTSTALFDDDVKLDVDPGIPDGGSYEGLDGVRRYMSTFLESWDSLTIAAKSFQDAGDKVLVAVRQAGTGQGSGVPVELEYSQLWTFRDGKVVRLEVIMSEERARAGLAG